MPLVFQYGSNCDETRLNAPTRLAGDAHCLGRAQTLNEYEIAFDIWSQTNACAASNLVRSSAKNSARVTLQQQLGLVPK
jgi:hypothetical protein